MLLNMHRDTEACERAIASRDARFDGWFFCAVVTTGIYCRPSCPARPHRKNLRFYPSAAAAQKNQPSKRASLDAMARSQASVSRCMFNSMPPAAVSYTHLRAHETDSYLV